MGFVRKIDGYPTKSGKTGPYFMLPAKFIPS